MMWPVYMQHDKRQWVEMLYHWQQANYGRCNELRIRYGYIKAGWYNRTLRASTGWWRWGN